MTTMTTVHGPLVQLQVTVPDVRDATAAGAAATTATKKKIIQVAVVLSYVLFVSSTPVASTVWAEALATSAATTTTMKTSNIMKTKIEIPTCRFAEQDHAMNSKRTGISRSRSSHSDNDTPPSSPMHPLSSLSSGAVASSSASTMTIPTGENSDTSSESSSFSSSSSYCYFQPSREFQRKRIHKSIRAIDWCPVSSMLPLQHYHAKKSSSVPGTGSRTESGSIACDGNHDDDYRRRRRRRRPVKYSTIAPDLETVLRNPSSYNLSKTSQFDVEDFITKYGHDCSNSSGSNDGNNISSSSIDKYDRDDARTQLQTPQQHCFDFDGDSQRLWNKLNAEYRASRPVTTDSLEILYQDEHMVVVNKPSGVLSVPGPRRNPSLLQVVYDVLRPPNIMNMDQMVVHRLDMATSGILIYALSLEALTALHDAFKNRDVTKTYQALVHGHYSNIVRIGQDNNNIDNNIDIGIGIVKKKTTNGAEEGEIDVLLERDPYNPPFMRVAHPRPTTNSDHDNYDLSSSSSTDDNTNGDDNNSKQKKTHKFWREAPKPSLTTWKVISREWIHDDGNCDNDADGNDRSCSSSSSIGGRLPVTRLELRPWTGRTHQLRVHTSEVLGMPIVGDDIYHTGSCSKYVKGKEQQQQQQRNEEEDDDGNRRRERPLCLHAQKLSIRHPISGASMIFEADPPF